ncbi:MAG: hypothetical protein H6572_03675 [Lewinellaceae bacterium]|nr:hypothetical protein [Lewinellaceae bacterium]
MNKIDKSKLPLILIGIGIFTILISGIPEKLNFEALGNILTGIIFIIIGLITYTKNKKTRDNK